MIAETLRVHLVSLATDYAQATGLALATVSGQFYGNPTFFEDFRRGKRSVSIDKYEEIVGKFYSVWPKGHVWTDIKISVKHRSPRRRIAYKHADEKSR